MNLSAINQLTCTGAASFGGTLNVSGDTGAAILMTYGSDSGDVHRAAERSSQRLSRFPMGRPIWPSFRPVRTWNNTADSEAGTTARIGARQRAGQRHQGSSGRRRADYLAGDDHAWTFRKRSAA